MPGHRGSNPVQTPIRRFDLGDPPPPPEPAPARPSFWTSNCPQPFPPPGTVCFDPRFGWLAWTGWGWAPAAPSVPVLVPVPVPVPVFISMITVMMPVAVPVCVPVYMT
jgi:hypothetical protein